ncbi:MAG: flavin reductase family protein [Acidimicrobiales bacterium]
MDAQLKKVSLRAINYGLYVLAATDGDEYGAGGVNWLTQVSFEPPLVAAGVKADSGSAAIIERTGVFAVSVLADDQLDVGKVFFRSTVTGGDHTVYVAEVVNAGVRDGADDRTPLLLRSTGMNYGG